MKVVMKQIDVIALFNAGEVPQPIRYRLQQGDEAYMTIHIEKVISKKEEKLAGNKMLTYTCQSVINNTLKIYEIKYELSTCKWFLYKI